MAKKVVVSATQMRCVSDVSTNIQRATNLVREAAQKGANIILLQELFASLYFCQEENNAHFSLAEEALNSKLIQHFQLLAKELDVVLPISFFEKSNQVYYNSLVTIDANGDILGLYRKSHIPAGPGYQEKYYFTPGDTGFKVFETKFGRLGAAICWDQWFSEPARIMALQGADILLYPTAIGSEPHDPSENSMERWQKCMIGHAITNNVAVVASNRVGVEQFKESSITFYGSSFIANHKGEMLNTADTETECAILAEICLDEMHAYRNDWPFFRDRRPELYAPMSTKDGR